MFFKKKKKEKKGLLEITDIKDLACELNERLLDKCDDNDQPINMTHPQRVIFLCVMIENAGQADMISEFFESYPTYYDEVVSALTEIGAVKSAELIRSAINLIPKEGVFSLDEESEEWEKIMDIDEKFAFYPDGLLAILYFCYVHKHKKDFEDL